DSPTGQNATLNHEQNLPRGHRLILGDMDIIQPRNACMTQIIDDYIGKIVHSQDNRVNTVIP
ncbi:hypothetical protein KAT55_02285, partial [Candidatus Bathyarchaeota archaeon]|nr:hypothetical protein [Candidatus Bathyarchaeota archaeon]